MAATNKSKQQAAAKSLPAIQINVPPAKANPFNIHIGPPIEEVLASQAAYEASREGMPRIEMGRTDFEKSIDRSGDPDVEVSDVDPFYSNNPLKELVARHSKPGESYAFHSTRADDLLGTRGYEPVVDKNGDQVKCGTLMLTKIPTRIVELRAKRKAQDAKERIVGIDNGFRDSAEKIKQDGADMGLRVLDQTEMESFRESGLRLTDVAQG